MRRWLPFHIMLAVVIALTLFSLQLVFAQTDPTAPPAGQTIQLQRTDTLVALAARFGKPVACLQKANKLAATNFSLTGLTTILIPDDCAKVLGTANSVAATPTPESAESLTTATFTPVASGATKQPTATPASLSTVVADQVYTVVNGDRLAKIAEKFGLTVACIANSNSISNPDLIYTGQQLRITANCTGGSGGGAVVSSVDPQACRYDRNPGRVAPNDRYTVQVGDALDFIACDFGIELQCLKDSNPQLGGVWLLIPGQVLNINFSCPVWRDSSLPPAK